MTTEAPPFDPAKVVHEDVTLPPESEAPSPEAQPRPAGFIPRRSPVRRTRKTDTTPKAVKAPKATKDNPALKKALAELYGAAGLMLMPFDSTCGTVVVNSADQCAEALVKLADENEAVKRLLNALTQTSAIGGVLAAHLPIIMVVASHHFGEATSKIKMPDNVVPMPDRDGA